jgi:hypothetical protein
MCECVCAQECIYMHMVWPREKVNYNIFMFLNLNKSETDMSLPISISLENQTIAQIVNIYINIHIMFSS